MATKTYRPSTMFKRVKQMKICHLCLQECISVTDLKNHIDTDHDMKHPSLQYEPYDCNMSDIDLHMIMATKTISSVAATRFERLTQMRICHLCLQECLSITDLQNHIATDHDMKHPSLQYEPYDYDEDEKYLHVIMASETISNVGTTRFEPRSQMKVCHLCMQECISTMDLQNHIDTDHNMNHPTVNSQRLYQVLPNPMDIDPFYPF